MTESEKEYYAALGKFIDYFSRAESVIQVVLWKVSDIEESVAKAIFSGTRTRTAVDFIKRVAETKDITIPQDIVEAFGHLNAINTARDNIVHWGTSESRDGSRIISNSFMAHTERAIKEFHISTSALNDMTSDLAIIIVRLISHYCGRQPEESDSAWNDGLQIARAPFRYKSPQPNNTCRKTLQASRITKPRQKSSQE